MSDEKVKGLDEAAYGGVFNRLQLQTLEAVAKTRTYEEADALLGLRLGTIKNRMHTLREMWRRAAYVNAGFLNMVRRYPELKKLLEVDRRR